ncbi:MAG: pyridoxal phosphate-dependent aminotransferase, partial [Spirochaetota bacterium]
TSMPDAISLGVGEPDFITPWKISDSGIYAIKDGYTHYTPNRGIPELLSILSQDIHTRYKVDYDPQRDMIITVGVSQALDITLRTLINPGDEIIVFEPCYVSYKSNISLAYGTPVILQTDFGSGFQINIDQLKNAISDKTKAILLNYPSNPSGMNIDFMVLQQIADLATEHDFVIIADEIYSSITYENTHRSIIEFPGMKERTVYLNGFSKSYAMTGWRLGYTAGPEEIISAMLKIHQYTALCAPSMAQYAAVEAIKNGELDLQNMEREYTRRRNFITKRFNEIGLRCLKPQGAFYVFPNISSTGLTSEEFALQLLQKHKVAVIPGSVFGTSVSDHIRCSFATSFENIAEAMNRIEAFVTSIVH